ncbi:MAG: SUMF1/EgtB/PvdO family nonheme iron enzyme [Planctomycetota bacterium]
MPAVTAIQLPPPSRWQDLESLCRDLFAALWDDPQAKAHGRPGEAQQGVDVYGTARGRRAGVQCKLKSEIAGARLRPDEIRAELAKARQFAPLLQEFTIVTTAARSAADQRVEREWNDDPDRPFDLAIFGWDDVVERLAGQPDVLALHYGWLGFGGERRQRLDDYLDSVWREFLPLSMLAVHGQDHDAPTLPAVYTALDVDLDLWSPSRSDPSEPEVLPGDYYRTLAELRRAETPDASRRRLTALELVAAQDRCVLLGGPGSGKSSFAKYLALCLSGERLGKPTNLDTLVALGEVAAAAASDSGDSGSGDPESPPSRAARLATVWPHGVLVPVWVELRAFVADAEAFPGRGATPTAENLMAHLRRRPKLPVADVMGELRALLSGDPLGRGVQLVLDGLDELGTHPDLDPGEVRQRLRQVLRAFLQAYPACRVLVTSRPHAYEHPDGRLDDLGFRARSLDPFDPPKAQRFIAAWCADLEARGHCPAGVGARQAQSLQRAVAAHAYLKPLAERPLLLTLLTNLHAAGHDVSGGRSKLYAQTVELLFDRWNRHYDKPGAHSFAEDLGLPRAKVLRALEEVALRVHREASSGDGAALIPFEVIWDALGAVRGPDTPVPVDDRKVIEYLRDRSGILLTEDEQRHRYRFPHRSFQEYLASRRLLRDPDFPDEFGELVRGHVAHWREVAIFCVLAADPAMAWVAVEELVPSGPPEGALPHEAELRAAIVAGAALVESGLHRQPGRRNVNKRDGVRTWLTRCLTDERLAAPERIEAGEALGVLGDARIGHRLENFREIEAGSPKLLGVYPVTVQEYEEFIKADGYDMPEWWTHEGGAERRAHFGWTKPEGWEGQQVHGNRPVVGVSWDEAMAYCAWCSKCKEIAGYEARLPTAEEWLVAALPRDRRWPWGSEDLDEERANYGWSVGAPNPVGVYPLGRGDLGHWDLAGNVEEWCADERGPPLKGREEYGPRRELRGGSWALSAENLGHWLRVGFVYRAADRSVDLGFRVLLSPASR